MIKKILPQKLHSASLNYSNNIYMFCSTQMEQDLKLDHLIKPLTVSVDH